MFSVFKVPGKLPAPEGIKQNHRNYGQFSHTAPQASYFELISCPMRAYTLFDLIEFKHCT
jgi:hypothetical protein